MSEFSDNDPTFGRVDEIYLLGASTIVLILSPCSAIFDSHYQAYFIELFPNQIIMPYSRIVDHSVYHCHRIKKTILCVLYPSMHFAIIELMCIRSFFSNLWQECIIYLYYNSVLLNYCMYIYK